MRRVSDGQVSPNITETRSINVPIPTMVADQQVLLQYDGQCTNHEKSHAKLRRSTRRCTFILRGT